jgi:molecular chaperone HscB
MNYFEFYDLPVSFSVNEEEVKRKFIELSRKYHPDYFSTDPPEKQLESLNLSTFNTKAFQTLSDADRRMKYVLELKNLIHEGERHDLPDEFLLDMMDLNEAISEIKSGKNAKGKSQLEAKVHSMLDELRMQIEPLLKADNHHNASASDLRKIKEYYYKRKYLLRIKESLDTFDHTQ